MYKARLQRKRSQEMKPFFPPACCCQEKENLQAELSSLASIVGYAITLLPFKAGR
jgi:hypothetical protein